MANATFDPQTRTYRDERGGEIPFRALNLYKVIGGPNGSQEAPQAPAMMGSAVSVAPPAGVAPIQAPPMAPQMAPQGASMGMSYVGNGALNPQPSAPGALNVVPLADASPLMSAAQPEQPKDGLFSFMNNPGATDSLVAFGSAMLRAPNFNTGLADAADAVNKVAQQYRQPTPREIALAQLRGRLTRAAQGGTDAQGYEWDTKNRIVGDDGNTYYPGMGPDGLPAFYNISNGQIARSVTGGASDTYSAIANQNKKQGFDTGEQISAFEAQVQAAPGKIAGYDALMSTIDTAGVGTDVWTQVTGRLAELTGTNIAGIDIADRGVAQQQIANMNVAASQALKGQGQVTEFERKLLADTLPQMTMNKDAAKTVIDILKKAEQRKIDQYMRYQQLLNSGVRMPWTAFVIQYGQELEAQQGQKNQPKGNTPAAGGERPSLDSIFN